MVCVYLVRSIRRSYASDLLSSRSLPPDPVSRPGERSEPGSTPCPRRLRSSLGLTRLTSNPSVVESGAPTGYHRLRSFHLNHLNFSVFPYYLTPLRPPPHPRPLFRTSSSGRTSSPTDPTTVLRSKVHDGAVLPLPVSPQDWSPVLWLFLFPSLVWVPRPPGPSSHVPTSDETYLPQRTLRSQTGTPEFLYETETESAVLRPEPTLGWEVAHLLFWETVPHLVEPWLRIIVLGFSE